VLAVAFYSLTCNLCTSSVRQLSYTVKALPYVSKKKPLAWPTHERFRVLAINLKAARCGSGCNSVISQLAEEPVGRFCIHVSQATRPWNTPAARPPRSGPRRVSSRRRSRTRRRRPRVDTARREREWPVGVLAPAHVAAEHHVHRRAAQRDGDLAGGSGRRVAGAGVHAAPKKGEEALGEHALQVVSYTSTTVVGHLRRGRDGDQRNHGVLNGDQS
jgi:hypothetical protein